MDTHTILITNHVGEIDENALREGLGPLMIGDFIPYIAGFRSRLYLNTTYEDTLSSACKVARIARSMGYTTSADGLILPHPWYDAYNKGE